MTENDNNKIKLKYHPKREHGNSTSEPRDEIFPTSDKHGVKIIFSEAGNITPTERLLRQ